MFDLKFIQKTLQEYKESLILEFQNLRNELSSKQIFIFEKYLKENSLAGMNTWLQNYSELKYFKQTLKQLKNSQEITSFQEMISKNLIEDFGEEDFRFLEWERTNSNKKDLENIIKHWIKETQSKLLDYNKTYSTQQNSLNWYLKANEDPSKIGASVKLIPFKTPKDKILQLKFAEEELQKFFPYGYSLYKILTQKIIIVQSEGLVSYSFFHEPGISYINVIDRNLLQTIDDLIHENAHHHLNLILKKYKILKSKHTQKVFYSPWRKELRGIYAILHAVFTFSFGAKLFFEIVNHWDKCPSKLTQKDFETCCARFIEETLMLEYSLNDLNKNLEEFTNHGKKLIATLNKWNHKNKEFLKQFESNVKQKKLLNSISNLKKTLQTSREEYKDYKNSLEK